MSHDDGNRQTLRKLRPHHGIEVGQVGRVEGLVLLCEVPDRGSESGGRMHLQTMPCSRRLGAIILSHGAKVMFGDRIGPKYAALKGDFERVCKRLEAAEANVAELEKVLERIHMGEQPAFKIASDALWKSRGSDSVCTQQTSGDDAPVRGPVTVPRGGSPVPDAGPGPEEAGNFHTCPWGSPGFFPNCNGCVFDMQGNRANASPPPWPNAKSNPPAWFVELVSSGFALLNVAENAPDDRQFLAPSAQRLNEALAMIPQPWSDWGHPPPTDTHGMPCTKEAEMTYGCVACADPISTYGMCVRCDNAYAMGKTAERKERIHGPRPNEATRKPGGSADKPGGCSDSVSIDHEAMRASAFKALVDRNIELSQENRELRARTEPAKVEPIQHTVAGILCVTIPLADYLHLREDKPKPWQTPSWGAIEERKAIAEWLRTPAAHMTALSAQLDCDAKVVCNELAEALEARTAIVEAEAAKRDAGQPDWEKRAEEAVETLGQPSNEGEYRIPHKALVDLLKSTYLEGRGAVAAEILRCICAPDYQAECCPKHGRFSTLEQAWTAGREHERSMMSPDFDALIAERDASITHIAKMKEVGPEFVEYEDGYRDGENNILADLDLILDEEALDERILERVRAMVEKSTDSRPSKEELEAQKRVRERVRDTVTTLSEKKPQ